MNELSKSPAFPVTELNYGMDGLEIEQKNGLTKREYFSAKAMQGFMSNPTESEITSTYVIETLGLGKETKYSFKEHYFKYVAQISVGYADALIEALNVEATNSGVAE